MREFIGRSGSPPTSFDSGTKGSTF
jgi:hypothetical protein